VIEKIAHVLSSVRAAREGRDNTGAMPQQDALRKLASGRVCYVEVAGQAAKSALDETEEFGEAITRALEPTTVEDANG
jgi:hypothetical protein